MRALLVTLILSAFTVARAQEAPPQITAANVHTLSLARTVRYNELAPAGDGIDALPLSGWFTLSPDGSLLMFAVENGVRIVSAGEPSAAEGVLLRAGATVIDARWNDTSDGLAVVFEQDGGYVVSVMRAEPPAVLPVPESAGVPVRVWFDAASDNYVWLETTPAPEDPDRSRFQVVRLDLNDPLNEAPFALPTGPEHDFDSLVRIGRIPAPLAITATFEGLVRRWDLQTGEITAEVELPAAPTFGRVNETNGIEFAWRDEASTALHLLNFETGEDSVIAPLNGEYIQALLLSPDASAVLAVHRGDRPSISAWIAATGEEIALGDYDTSVCSRVPDMVQLSRSGTRLVIGCDRGFQVWEVSG